MDSAFRIGEETLTDLNLLTIAVSHPTEVRLHKFTKRVEPSSGADWEWWLTGPSGGWLGLRIQAKVIDLERMNFPYLHYRHKGGTKSQSETLIQAAQRNRPALVPLYCLYCNWHRSAHRPKLPCGFRSTRVTDFGCSIVSAHRVYSLQTGGVDTLNALLPYMLPWHCLTCCHVPTGADLPDRALHVLRRWLGTAPQEGPATGMCWPEAPDLHSANEPRAPEELAGIEVGNQPPPYIMQMLQNEPIQAPDDALRGIMVVGEGVDLSEVSA